MQLFIKVGNFRAAIFLLCQRRHAALEQHRGAELQLQNKTDRPASIYRHLLQKCYCVSCIRELSWKRTVRYFSRFYCAIRTGMSLKDDESVVSRQTTVNNCAKASTARPVVCYTSPHWCTPFEAVGAAMASSGCLNSRENAGLKN